MNRADTLRLESCHSSPRARSSRREQVASSRQLVLITSRSKQAKQSAVGPRAVLPVLPRDCCSVAVQGRRDETGSLKAQPATDGAFKSHLKMASNSPRRTTFLSSSPPNSSPISRLQSIANHMAPASITSFPAEVVPQAPEDPLFGLMRAFKADESPDKVDLVRHDTDTCCSFASPQQLC